MATVSNSTSRIMNVKLLSLIIIQVESSAAIDVFIGHQTLIGPGSLQRSIKARSRSKSFSDYKG